MSRTAATSKRKPYWKMNTHELAEATREFDREFVADTFEPLTAADRELHRRAKKRGGRPKVGKGARRVLVTIEGGLLEETDAFAKANGFSRAQLIAQGLRAVMGKRGKSAARA